MEDKKHRNNNESKKREAAEQKIDLGPHMSIFTLSVNDLNTSIKRQILAK